MRQDVKLVLYALAVGAALLAALTWLTGCGKGPAGPTGAIGPQGAPGANGSPGATGPAGSNGTTVTVVKLCPGTTAYPSTFVEVAFCIGGKLYATYSANDGFSTEIPPGTYSSNGVNASCTFTVGPNCTVSQ